MLPTAHAVISGVLGVGIYKCTGSAASGISAFLSGVFIDLDHHLDYFIALKKVPLSYKKLLDFFEFDYPSYPKVYLFFHAWEFLALLWAIIYILHLNVVWIGFALGITVHMICDQIVNPLKPLGYFIIYRIKHGFLKKDILTDAYFQKKK